MTKKLFKIDKRMGESRAAQVSGAVLLVTTLGIWTIILFCC